MEHRIIVPWLVLYCCNIVPVWSLIGKACNISSDESNVHRPLGDTTFLKHILLSVCETVPNAPRVGTRDFSKKKIKIKVFQLKGLDS